MISINDVNTDIKRIAGNICVPWLLDDEFNFECFNPVKACVCPHLTHLIYV